MKYIVIYYGKFTRKWYAISDILQNINEAHKCMDMDRIINKGIGCPHWQVVEETTDLTTLPPPK